MENIKDFLEGADPKKAADKKKKVEEKPHQITREEEFPDDKLYGALMDQYKMMRHSHSKSVNERMMRRQDRKAASKILEKAQKLGRKGKVSQKAFLGGAYL